METRLTEAETSRFVQAGPIRVHYNEAGDGPVLIFCEGQGPGTSAWVVYHRVIDALSQRFRCLLLDQPGYGKSDPVVVTGESRSTMYARTVRDFMDALGIEKASIVDMSFGAQTGLAFAVDYPDRLEKLVLHASGSVGPTMFAIQPMEGVSVMAETFQSPSLDSMRRMMNAFLYDGAQYSDADLMLEERLAAWLARPELEAARAASARVQRDLGGQLKGVTKPILQIHGRQDKVMPLESAMHLFNQLNDSTLVVLAKCGHWIPFERPDKFCRLVTDFMDHE